MSLSALVVGKGLTWFDLCHRMLLFTLAVIFLSPITFLSVTSLSLPKIEKFKHIFQEIYDDRNRVRHNLDLTCIVSGNPAPSIQFQFNGYNVQNTTRILQIHGRLIVRDISYGTDEGHYKCVAKNSYGQVFQEKLIRIPTYGKFLPGNQQSDPARWIDVKVGEPWELFCPEHTHIYPAKYRWGKEDPVTKKMRWLDESSSIHVLEKGSLYFNSLTDSDIDKVTKDFQGISCVIEAGPKGLSRYIISKRMLFRKIGIVYNDSAPSITVEFQGNMYAEKGEDITLRCIARGNPIPRLQWFRNGQIIQSDNSRYGINPYLPTKLTVRQVDETVTGQYKCVATNRAGSDFTVGTLHIATSPKFVKDLPPISNVTQGEMLRLLCSADGTKPMNYKCVSMVVSNGVLTITPARYQDYGIYQCSAINKYGSQSSVTEVNIQIPKVTKGKHNGGKNETIDNGTNTNNNNNNRNTNRDKSNAKSEPLQMQHIIIIACGGTVFVILLGGGIFMYCRTKDDSKEVRFIATPRHEIQKPFYSEEIDLPPPPRTLTDSDDDLSSFGGTHKMNEFIDLMSDIRSSQNTTPSKTEHLYYDIPDDVRSNTTPLTDL
ncbi:contactin-5-like isoform X2 [Hydractinia symbiolongicarpus]|uniref:contactin-5-like isoform X2 n=1 Tax=Hydractinia symbiolongicarpus TaxID=13093 RepID=UPI002550E191|nr:contactin-5-like isoform X2 [Hydractinia symbiolongicarpus]